MNIASIDIGTNTVLMLITKVIEQTGELTALYQDHRIPRIGKGVAETGKISKEKIAQLTEILTEFRESAEEYSCDVIIASGTYPFRAADNALDVIAEVHNKTGIRIRALPGEEEALCSYLGATGDSDFEGRLCVIDIGGGSTELITGNKGTIEYRNSAPFGVVNSTEQLIKDYPVPEEKLSEIRLLIREKIKANYQIPTAIEKAIAIAGTPTTLACINQNLNVYNEEKIHKSILTKDRLEVLITYLAFHKPEEVKAAYAPVVDGREDVLLMGALILSEVMTFLNINEVEVSSHGLRYGAIHHWLSLQL